MCWDFSATPFDQSSMYKILTRFWNMGKVRRKPKYLMLFYPFCFEAPILFSASNSSANYTSKDWMNRCYERFYEVGGQYVVYWLVDGDMYCEVVCVGTTNNYQPTFAQRYLFRSEYHNKWCPL
uniref:Uncharacterized protein n=1 Tax=Caenorhabditis japonica TaxID=281687 RepID=A0A8R1IVG3_CAEJA